jgi:transposase
MGHDRFGFSQDRPHSVDASGVGGVPTDTAEKLKALGRENRELRQANEVPRKASAYFAQAEFDRRVKP